MFCPDKALTLVKMMLNCAKSGANLPILVVKKCKNKPDKVVNGSLFCPIGLDELYSVNEYWSSRSTVPYETFKFINDTLYYHNLKKLPTHYTNDDRNKYLTKDHKVVGQKRSKRQTGVFKREVFYVAQIEITETARILYGRGNADL